ncbi:ATP-binding cassette domain-containing protein [bacterium]|nr:ATP-binding cassette domain-containing protein [bacterium]
MAFLELDGVSKSFTVNGKTKPVLREINLSIEQGEFVAIVGFSGSGKTTLMSLMAGLILPDEGEVRLHGERVTGPSPNRGIVFQNYSLLPWLTVFENVKLAVDQVCRGWTTERKRERVLEYLKMVNLSPAAQKRPAQLSGGMRQRVSVARTLAMDPEVLLLDEPLGALDALTRATLQDEIERIWERDRKTCVLITNDLDEALLLADRIIPMTAGPGATLGPSFAVDAERPRDRRAIAKGAEFKHLRRELTEWLLTVARQQPTLPVSAPSSPQHPVVSGAAT